MLFTLYPLAGMILISLIALIVQADPNQFRPRRKLAQVTLNEDYLDPSTEEDVTDEISLDQVSHLNACLPCIGKDIPFHIVKDMSSEMSTATRNYLQKMDGTLLMSNKIPTGFTRIV